MQQSYYLKKLKENFSRRQRGNSAYSLRAYARDLALHPSTLSQVLHGRRPLPMKDAPRVIDRLGLGAKERTLFTESMGRKRTILDQIKIPENEESFLLDETYFQIIAEWEHYATLNLIECEGFQASVNSIAERLGISTLRAEVVLENLLQYGMVVRTPAGTLERAHVKLRTTEDTVSAALQASHRESLELGKDKLNEIAVELRDFSSIMMAVDLEKLSDAKTMIREFRKKMSAYFKTGRRTEVFQLAIQFYPVSKIQSQAKEEMPV